MTIQTQQPGVQEGPIPAARAAMSISVETMITVAIVIIATAIRWINLGAAPLSGPEAPQAIAAWHLLAPSAAPGAGAISSILIFAGTVVSFAIAGPATAAARFVPALAGTALAMAPLLFRHRLGRIGTLVCMLILAISPSAVIDSRQMTGVGLVMFGVVALLAAIDRYITTSDKTFAVIGGIALAVMLLADFGSIAILVMLAAGVALAMLTDEEGEFSYDTLSEGLREFPWAASLIGLGTTTVLLGTLFYLAPTGLAAAADQVAQFFGGLLTRPAGVPYLGLVIFAYEPYLLVFGLIAAWYASQSPLAWQRFLAGWTIAAIIISLAYPGALPAHALWVVVPLAALTTLLVVDMLRPIPDVPWLAVAVHAAGTVGLIAMILGSLARELMDPQLIPIGTGAIPYDLVLIIMWAILGTVLWLAISSIWGRLAAWHGFGLGAAAAGLALAVGLSAAMAFTRPTNPYELFNSSPADPTLPVMIQTAEDISLIAVHDRHDAGIIVKGDPNSMLAWSLKDFHSVTYVSAVPASTQSVMVITPAEGDHPSLGSNYVGQSFVVARQWSITGLDLPRFLKWLIYRSDDGGTVTQQRIILWVRSDVYQLVPKDTTTH